MKLKVLVAAALVIVMASVAAAQFGRFQGGFGGLRRYPPRYPKADTFGHGFNFCRGIYTQHSRRSRRPGLGHRLSRRRAELLHPPVRADANARRAWQNGGRPDYLTVRLTDDSLFQCPYLHMEDVGTVTFSEREVEALRELPAQGRVHLGGRLLGLLRVGAVGVGDLARAAAVGVSDPGHHAGPSV